MHNEIAVYNLSIYTIPNIYKIIYFVYMLKKINIKIYKKINS